MHSNFVRDRPFVGGNRLTFCQGKCGSFSGVAGICGRLLSQLCHRGSGSDAGRESGGDSLRASLSMTRGGKDSTLQGDSMRMNNSWLVVLAAAFAVQESVAASQDTVKWLLNDFRRPAANNAEFEKYHLGATYDNHETICPGASIHVSAMSPAQGGYADIQTTKSQKDFSSCTGILFPIDPWWTENNDLREIKELRFKSRNLSSVNIALDGLAVPLAAAGYHPAYQVDNSYPGNWSWNTIKFPSEDFFYPGWVGGYIPVYAVDSLGHLVKSEIKLTKLHRRSRLLNKDSSNSSDYQNDSVNILKNVRAIKFEFENTTGHIGIDSIMLVGVSPTWPRVNGKLCQGTSALLDDFSATKSDPSRNLLGGAWWAVSDTDSFHPQSMGTGKSQLRSKHGAWAPSPELGAASLVADLDRVDPDAHPDAGWASLFTNVPAGSLEKLNAISMKIRAGGDNSFPFDSSRVMGVVFRAIGPNFADSLVYEARIPFRQIHSTPNDSSICLDLSELRQPAWYTGAHGIKRVSPKDILRFSWSLILQDPSATTASTSRIDLKEVRLWGIEPTSSIGGKDRPRQEIGIRHRDGIRLSYSVPGDRAQVRIVRLDGSTASAFAAPATVSDMPLPAGISRGSYAIEVTGAGMRRTARFVVP